MIDRKDGKLRQFFPTAAHMLRWCLNEEVFERVRKGPGKPRFSDVHLTGPLGPSNSFAYHVVKPGCEWRITYGHIEQMIPAQGRYAAIVHHLREVEPEWRPDTSVSPSGEIHYADNSIELHEIDKRGSRRRHMVVPPHGDTH